MSNRPMPHRLSNRVRLGVLALCATIGPLAACSADDSERELDALSSPTQAGSPAATLTEEQPRPIFDGTEREWLYAYAGCMEEGGFVVAIDEEKGTFDSVDLPPEQYDAWNTHMEKCGQQVGDPYIEELTEAQVRALFKDYLAAAECLQGLGYDVSDPPSRESWVKSWENNPNWLPHRDVGKVVDNPAEWERVNEECPQPDA